MMKYVWRVGIILLLLLCMLLLVPSGAIVAYGEVVEIPLDAKKGMAPLEEGYLSDLEYEDPSISVKIEKGRIYETNYVVARVKIANASQLRTVMAASYYSPSTLMGTTMAKRTEAVLAINGDFFSSRNGHGYVARQGKEYRNACNSRIYDILIIDDQGDLHILEKPDSAEVEAFEGTPVQGFTFGPGLIVNGEVKRHNVKDFEFDCAAGKSAQRMCLAQVGPLEYLCICSEGPEDPGSVGLTLDQFTDLVASFEGIENAYNLDGGSSSTMVFKGDKVNSPNNPKRRPLCDMIYFASAWDAQ
ncbi:MAG: phosphodiester glycosidase family protein [Clostridia bacterium]|nr:phosphodiester glycosidase family protein [Clostridia bacterium]